MERAGIEPEDINRLEDLGRFPICTKEDFVSKPVHERMGEDPKKCIRHSSSGTTGDPMVCYRSKKYYDYLAGYNLQGHYISLRKVLEIGPFDRIMRIVYGMPWEKDGKSKTNPRSKEAIGIAAGIIGPIHDRFAKTIHFRSSADEIIPEIIEFRPKLIVANPSYLRILADTVSRREISEIRPKALLVSGEVLDESTRKYLETIFHCKTFQRYSVSEVGKIAFECERRALHVSDSLIVEILNDGKPSPPGEPGKIVVTVLLNDAMPLLRYDVGDVGIWSDSECQCGRSSRVLRSMEGRQENHLTIESDRFLSPLAVLSALHQVADLPRWQVVQESTESCKLRIFNQEENQRSAVAELVQNLRILLGEKVKVEISSETHEQLRAKFRPVISHLNMRDNRWTMTNENSSRRGLSVSSRI